MTRMMDKVIARQTKDWTRFSVDTLTSLMTLLHDRTKITTNKNIWFFFSKRMAMSNQSKEERKRETEKDSSEMLEASRGIIYHHDDNYIELCSFRIHLKCDQKLRVSNTTKNWMERNYNMVKSNKMLLFLHQDFSFKTVVVKWRRQPRSLAKTAKQQVYFVIYYCNYKE